ncbi:transposase, partial [Tersicoccus phoenicis]
LALLGELWPLVSMRLNFFTPTKKPTGYATTADGRRKRLYDTPRTPWQRVLASGLLSAQQVRAVQTRIEGVNPADLTRRINQIQLRLIDLSRDRTEAMTASRHLDMASLEPSIRRLQTTR